MSVHRWAVEATYLIELDALKGVYSSSYIMEHLTYS